jgi:hypothetical protein
MADNMRNHSPDREIDDGVRGFWPPIGFAFKHYPPRKRVDRRSPSFSVLHS